MTTFVDELILSGFCKSEELLLFFSRPKTYIQICYHYAIIIAKS